METRSIFYIRKAIILHKNVINEKTTGNINYSESHEFEMKKVKYL